MSWYNPSSWFNTNKSLPTGEIFNMEEPDLADIIGKYFTSWFGQGQIKKIQVSSLSDYAKAWTKCPPLTSIIVAKAQADTKGRVAFKYKYTDEPVKGNYNPAVSRIRKLLDQPNPFQNWERFRTQQKVYIQLFGFCPVLHIMPSGFKKTSDRSYATSMWNIPPHLLTIETTGKLFYQSGTSGVIKRVVLRAAGLETELPIENLMFITDQSISLNYEVLPDSRVKVLQDPISNIVACYEAMNTIVTKRGALGIFSNNQKDPGGYVPITTAERDDLQKQFKDYGLSKKQLQYIITTAGLQWQAVGMKVSELMLIEIAKDGIERLCDTYGYPFELISNQKGTTFANASTADRRFFDNTVIPENESDLSVYNAWFSEELGDKVIYCDFAKVAALQQSEKERGEGKQAIAQSAETMWNNNIITLNRMREMLGEETVDGDDIYKYEFDKQNQPEGDQQGQQQGANQAAA